jgi:hypothetical protein
MQLVQGILSKLVVRADKKEISEKDHIMKRKECILRVRLSKKREREKEYMSEIERMTKCGFTMRNDRQDTLNNITTKDKTQFPDTKNTKMIR